DLVTREKRLRERLRSLQSRGRGGRAEAAQAGRLEAIDDARDERLLRADDREADGLAPGELDERVRIVRAHRRVARARLARGARVARGDDHLVDERRLRRFPRDRVLAPAGADDEYLHRKLTSMPKMPHSREDHRHAVLVRRLYDLRIAHGAPGLYHRGDAVRGGDVETVPERKEGVGRHRRAFEREVLLAGLRDRDLRAHHPARLPAADAERPAVARIDYRVRLHVFHDGPREQHVANLLLRRRALGDRLEVAGTDRAAVRLLHEHAAVDRAKLDLGLAARALARLDHADV